MTRIFLALCVMMISCCSSNKTAATTANTETDSLETNIPGCIRELITKFKREEKTNPLRSVWQYSYNGKTVYYIPAICCDFFSDLYDDQCQLIAHPDGGFTGRGDGKAKDFAEVRSNEKLIWKDKR